jgi:histidinol-phosphate/aromatic aminotransferase/cobyric acid decarboxylase-like protein
VGALAERGIPMAESHTNFIFFELGERADRVVEEMTTNGVIIRAMSGGWVRVTIGNDDENRRFVEVLDAALAAV